MPRTAEIAATDPTTPKLLEQLRQALRSRHYNRRAERTYCQWGWRFIFFYFWAIAMSRPR